MSHLSTGLYGQLYYSQPSIPDYGPFSRRSRTSFRFFSVRRISSRSAISRLVSSLPLIAVVQREHVAIFRSAVNIFRLVVITFSFHRGRPTKLTYHHHHHHHVTRISSSRSYTCPMLPTFAEQSLSLPRNGAFTFSALSHSSSHRHWTRKIYFWTPKGDVQMLRFFFPHFGVVMHHENPTRDRSSLEGVLLSLFWFLSMKFRTV